MVYTSDLPQFADSTAASLQQSVARATLTVTADDQSTAYGAAVPPLTFRVSGFVQDEDASVLSGDPALATTASAASVPGTYPILIKKGTLTTANYACSFVNGTLTVLPPVTASGLVSSVSVAVYAQPVTLTASVTSFGGTPTGTVTFLDGQMVVKTALLVNGSASLTTTALTRGSHSLRAVYGGDGIFPGSTSGLVVVQVQTAALEADPHTPGKFLLFVGGTAANDVITLEGEKKDREVEVEIHGWGPGAISFHKVYDTANLSGLMVFGGSGNDLIAVQGLAGLPAMLFAGGGNDILLSGSGPAVLVSGAGNDLLLGGSGHDILIGGPGFDVLVGRGSDLLIGGSVSEELLIDAGPGILFRSDTPAWLAAHKQDDGGHDQLIRGHAADRFFDSDWVRDLLGKRHGDRGP